MYKIVGIDRWGRLFEVGPQQTYERAVKTCMQLNKRAVERWTGCTYSISQVLDV